MKEIWRAKVSFIQNVEIWHVAPLGVNNFSFQNGSMLYKEQSEAVLGYKTITTLTVIKQK